MKKVYIGHTSYQQVVFEVAEESIRKNTNEVEILKIDRASLESIGIYKRKRTEVESTEFSFSRFLVPYLNGFRGWALFTDNDIVCLEDISELFETKDEKYALMCVKHNYQSKLTSKLDGQKQSNYPRKNWSSVVLWNCGHESNRVLTPELINNVSGLYLHRFMWLQDEEIGSLDKSWNYLADCMGEENIKPKLIHYTEGGPYFRRFQSCEYASIWLKEFESLKGRAFEEKDYI